eukprot:6424563-Alexandrium_andersonii.AAC.1
MLLTKGRRCWSRPGSMRHAAVLSWPSKTAPFETSWLEATKLRTTGDTRFGGCGCTGARHNNL